MIDYRADNLSLEVCNNPVIPPVIADVAPVNGTVFLQATFLPIKFSSTITDDKLVSSVIFNINGVNYNAFKNSNQYTYEWTPTTYGTVTLKITATDNENGVSLVTNTYTVTNETSINCNTIAPWDPNKIYSTKDNLVLYQGKIYKNAWWVQGGVPGVDNAWVFVQNCTLGTIDFEKEIEFSFYPTLVNDEAHLNFMLNEVKKVNIDFYDLNGKKVKSINTLSLQAGKNNIKVDLSEFQSGIYVYEIMINNNKIVGKFVKSN